MLKRIGPSPTVLCSVPLLASTAPPISSVSSLVSTWSSGAPALIQVDHLPPISSFSRYPAGLPLLTPGRPNPLTSCGACAAQACPAHSGRTICQNVGPSGGQHCAPTTAVFCSEPLPVIYWGALTLPVRHYLIVFLATLSFLAYTAIRTTDQATRDQLNYARLLIQESL